MGLGDLPRMGVSLIAASCAQASSNALISSSFSQLLAILISHDFLSEHATPVVAAALLHAAICFREVPDLAAPCCEAALAIIDACIDGAKLTGSSRANLRSVFCDGSSIPLAWCAMHIFVDIQAGGQPSSGIGASIACSALWGKLHQAGVIATQAEALHTVLTPANSTSLLMSQRLIRLADALPLKCQPAAEVNGVIPWSLRHHLSWMIEVESELLLQQLVPVWISRSSFLPLWVLQCIVQSPGDAFRCSLQASLCCWPILICCCRRWVIARLVLLHIKCGTRPEAVRCACCLLMFLGMTAISQPDENRHALEFLRAMIDGECEGS
jgi:hypothetical protein